MDSLSRLKRRIIGERLHASRPVVERAAKRSTVRPPTIEIPDHTRDTEFKLRPSRRRIDPTPNAPQLIRLNRSPFPLHRGNFERQKMSTFSLARPDRKTLSELINRQRLEAPVVLRPTSLHIRPPRRERLSADAWLSEQGDE